MSKFCKYNIHYSYPEPHSALFQCKPNEVVRYHKIYPYELVKSTSFLLIYYHRLRYIVTVHIPKDLGSFAAAKGGPLWTTSARDKFISCNGS